MRLIIRISFIVCLILINNLPIKAQYPKKHFTADFRMGVNFPHMSGVEGSTRFKAGLHIGGNVNYKVWKDFQVQMGLYVSKKGYSSSVKETNTSVDNIIRVDEKWYEATATYIQVPFNIGYELYITKNIAFNINGGVYAAYGYGNKGRIKYDALITTYEPNKDPKTEKPDGTYEDYTFSDTRWKRIDYGLNGSIGVIYDIYTLNLNYEHGLYNVTRNNATNLRHRVYSLSLGFRF